MFERLPFEKFHGDERPAVVLADVVNRADVGVVQRGRGLRFAPESLQGLAVPGKLSWEKLEGDEPMKPDVLGFEDDAHTATTDLFQDAVVGNSLANHEETPPVS